MEKKKRSMMMTKNNNNKKGEINIGQQQSRPALLLSTSI
jgi:hypothetical protein